MRYSFIVPVYNRPDEVDELLQSLTKQTLGNFEVLVIEDGSSVPCEDVVEKYRTLLDVHYYNKPNSGPGQTRNFGAERSRGEYLLILDSDCVLPPGYLAAVDEELKREPADAFGGSDRAHDSFSATQKAINYAMTSFFTTGGIRGGKRKWISSTPEVLIWEYVPMYIASWEVSRKCVSAKTSISVSGYSRTDAVAACFLKHGCGINAALI